MEACAGVLVLERKVARVYWIAENFEFFGENCNFRLNFLRLTLNSSFVAR